MASTQEVLERKFLVADCAKILNMSKTSVHRLIHNGELRAYRIGHKFVIPMSALRECVGNGLVNPDQEDR